MAEAVDSSEAWKAARVLRTLALSWEGWEAVVAGGWRPPTELLEVEPTQGALLSLLPRLLGERCWP